MDGASGSESEADAQKENYSYCAALRHFEEEEEKAK